MEFQRTQHYDLIYRTTKELGYRVNCGVENICIEISRGNKIVVERQIVKICENHISSMLLIEWTRKPEFEPEYEGNTDNICT
jgi:hypothetical protein